MKLVISLLTIWFAFINLFASNSVYTERVEDPEAVYFTPDKFNISNDGSGDVSDELQKAIRQVFEKTGFGILFIPEGEYAISKTIYIPAGVRMIGYGTNRPVFVLKKNTYGFTAGDEKYLFWFTANLPSEDNAPSDANPGTFYSAFSNIDLRIEPGNLATIGIRSHFAQHCFIAHVDFYIGEGKAGVEKVGNEMEDCRFFGGEYGIITTKPSPSWPFLMIDTYFEGQRKGAIRTQEGGLTIIRMKVKNAPAVIVIDEGMAEELWIEDSWFENIGGPAITTGDEDNARTFINLRNVLCRMVPIVIHFRLNNTRIGAPASSIYRITDFCHGNQIEDLRGRPEIKTTYNFEELKTLPLPVRSDIPRLPPTPTWVNIKTLGAKGDEKSDDTKILQEAIDKYNVIYLPTGRYRITETIKLKPATVLIGFSPIATQIIIKDNTEAYSGTGIPVALIETPKGGTNIINGIGMDAGGINPRALAVKWMSGESSYMNDVRFIGGHGTRNADGSSLPIYNANRTGDSNPQRRWDSQYWSLWITEGGGGIFKDIWTPSPFATAGLYISNTSTPGKIYAVSSEHHVRNEIKLKNVSNWKIYAIQMEEEGGEGPDCLPVEIVNSNDLLFVNLYLYRVIRMVSSYPCGVKVWNSRNIEFRGVHTYSPTKFSYDNPVYIVDYNIGVRSREISKLMISGNERPILSSENFSDAINELEVKKVAGGFEFIDGLVSDSSGNIYFIEGRLKRIYGYYPQSGRLKLISDLPIQPLALAFDQKGNLLVTTLVQSRAVPGVRNSGLSVGRIPGSEGTSYGVWGQKIQVLAMNPDNPENSLAVLPEMDIDSVKYVKTAWYPGHRWRDNHDFNVYAIARVPGCFVAPDGVTVIPNSYDLIRAYSLRKATPGCMFYIADEFGQKTVVATVLKDGTLSDMKLFAEEGEIGIAEDAEGNLYVAAGEIFMYDKTGKQMNMIRVPERPVGLALGGKDNKTLFIAAGSSLYSLQLKYNGK
jgi:sugar lactone lactonase YvrE